VHRVLSAIRDRATTFAWLLPIAAVVITALLVTGPDDEDAEVSYRDRPPAAGEDAGPGAGVSEGSGEAAEDLVVSLAPTKLSNSRLSFKLEGIAADSVREARLRNRKAVVPVRLSRVKTAASRGKLTVPVPPKFGKLSAKKVKLEIATAPPEIVTGPTPPGVGDVAVEVPPTEVATPVDLGPTSLSEIASGTTPSAACTPAYGSFNTTTPPPGCWRPYAESSPFNQVLPEAPQITSNSKAVVDRLLGFGQIMNIQAGAAGSTYDYGRPTYFSQPTDPVFTLHCTNSSWGTCPVEGEQIRVPDAARPAGGRDAHLTVIDQASGWEYDLFRVTSKPAGGGILQFAWGGKTRVNGNGLGSDAVAAEYGTAAGLLRVEELEAGEINHALFMTVHCDAGGYVYPATKGGRSCASIGLPTTDAPPEGTRFQLAMSREEINALSVPSWKKTILRAMARYGMFVGDTTGGAWGIQVESGEVYKSFGQEDKWRTFAKQVGAPYYAPDDVYVLNLKDGVDWASKLRVVAPCVSQGTC